MTSDDRREFQRLRLAKPILGMLEGHNALILDIGVTGAFVEHYGKPEVGERLMLLFRWKGTDVEYVCEVRRTNAIRKAANDVVSHSGLRFLQPVGDSEARLNDMVATFVAKILAAQRANAAATEAPESGALVDLGGAHRSRVRGFITYRLANGAWTRTSTESPVQPPDGFTVAAYEDPAELQTLCETFEAVDAEGRRLIRLIAELSARAMKR